MKYLRFISLALCLLAISSCALNTTSQDTFYGIEKTEQIWAGIYEGYGNLFHLPKLVQETTQIPGRVGMRFGFAFKLYPSPSAAKGIVSLTFRTTYPAPGIINPTTGKMMAFDESTLQCVLGRPCMAGYLMSSAAETKQGEWKLSISFRGKKIAEQTFVIVPHLQEAQTDLVRTSGTKT